MREDGDAVNVKSIPELLKIYGTIADTCRATGLNEVTISKFRFDTKCERHAIVNNRLMTHKKGSVELFTRRGVSRHDRNEI